MILLKKIEKKRELVRKNLQFDLTDRDQSMAYQILNSKKGEELRKFISKSVIMYEYIQQKSRYKELLKRGREMEKEIDEHKISSLPTRKKKEIQTREIEQNVEIVPEVQETTHGVQNASLETDTQNAQRVQNAQNTQSITNGIQNDIADNVNIPVQKEINTQSQLQETRQEKKMNSPIPETMAAEENLDEDIFANAMSFLSNMQ